MTSPFDPKPPPKVRGPAGPRILIIVGIVLTVLGALACIVGVVALGSSMFGMLRQAEQMTTTSTLETEVDTTIWGSVLVAIGSTLLTFGPMLWIGGVVWRRLGGGATTAWDGTAAPANQTFGGGQPQPPTIL